MSPLYTTLFLLSIALSVSTTPQNHSQPQPDQVIEIFRHGARSPLHSGDPTWPPSQYGDLTPVGMRQHYILGKTLAERYPTLFGTPYNYTQVYVMSDSVPRCVQSVVSQLYGIYLGTGPGLSEGYPSELAVPPYEDPVVQKIAASMSDSAALPYKNIPNIVNIVSDTNAYLFESDNTSICANSSLWEQQNYDDSDAEAALVTFGPTIANLNQYLDESDQISTLEDLKGYGDIMLADIIANKTILPGGITDPELILNLTYAFSWIELHVWAGQEVQKQMQSFGLLNATLEQLIAFREGEDFNNAVLFSGHDSNLYTILAALGIASEECVMANFYSELENGTMVYPLCYYPIFASNLIVEFYNATDAPYVKFYYNNKIIPLCHGEETCSYDEFISVLTNATGGATIESFFESCGTSPEQVAALGYNNLMIDGQEALFSVSNRNTSKVTTEMMIIMGLAMMIMMLVVKIVFDQRKYNKMEMEFRSERLFYSEIKEVKIN